MTAQILQGGDGFLHILVGLFQAVNFICGFGLIFFEET